MSGGPRERGAAAGKAGAARVARPGAGSCQPEGALATGPGVAKRLFVGNLPFSTTSDQLREVFGRIGECESATVVTDRVSGRSRGFGFVEMTSEDDAARAVTELDGSELEGRKLTVSTAHDRPAGGRPHT